MKEWLTLDDKTRRDIYERVGSAKEWKPFTVEKDWWVTLALKACFEISCAPHLVFKGGTSLSKAWDLIERFSEDIDLAIDRDFLGFKGELSKTQIGKLRKKSCEYISNDFRKELQSKFDQWGASSQCKIIAQPVTDTDKDPQVIEIHYRSVFDTSDYVPRRVLIEISARSLMEPSSPREIVSIIGAAISDQPFSDKPFNVLTVLPQKTFFEKIFLLHEEFSKVPEEIRVERLSRHLYDLEILMDTEYGKEALVDIELYKHIVAHREKYNHQRGLNYANHAPDKISIIPPKEVIGAWEKDYKEMQENMIYGNSKNFDALIKRMNELQERVRGIKM